MMLSKKFFVKILLGVFLGGIVLLSITLMYLIWDLPFDKLNKVSEGQKIHEAENVPEYLLEEGSGVLLEDLQNYYLFTDAKVSFSDWLKELLDEQKINVENERIFINKNFYVPALTENTCKDVYCFQHKIDFNHIPSVFWKGLIGIEDVRFLDHFGIDLKSILRAIIKDIQVQKLAQGGSTLTQQLVKNLFFTNERSIARKIKEIILSIYIEHKLSKEEILEIYFNEVYWGSLQGIHVRGIYAASSFYFSKKIEEITPYEAAILISLLKGPSYYNPLHNIERLKQRTRYVYDRLIQLQIFASDKSLLWSDDKWTLWHKKITQKNNTRPFLRPNYFWLIIFASLWRTGNEDAPPGR